MKIMSLVITFLIIILLFWVINDGMVKNVIWDCINSANSDGDTPKPLNFVTECFLHSRDDLVDNLSICSNNPSIRAQSTPFGEIQVITPTIDDFTPSFFNQ